MTAPRRTCRWLALLAALPASACLDNPYGRPATIVDGAEFPEPLRGVLLPHPAYADGEAVSVYLFGATDTDVGEAVVFVDQAGAPLPACRAGLRDGEGQLLDVDLGACQGALVPALPDGPEYTPFVSLAAASVPADYQLNSVRDTGELDERGVAVEPTGRVADYAIVDASASLIDPAERIPRLLGWWRGLQVAFLHLADDLPTSGDRVQSMELLVPVGRVPDDPDAGIVAQARAGQAGYSTVCSIVYFVAPVGYRPGDYTQVADIPAGDRRPPDPPELVHCAVP